MRNITHNAYKTTRISPLNAEVSVRSRLLQCKMTASSMMIAFLTTPILVNIIISLSAVSTVNHTGWPKKHKPLSRYHIQSYEIRLHCVIKLECQTSKEYQLVLNILYAT